MRIDRVIVNDSQVEIRYVVPTGPKGETTPFCHLRLDYFDLAPQTIVVHEWRVCQVQVTAEQDDMGSGLGAQVRLREDDDIQRLCELLVEQLRLVHTGLDVPLHRGLFEGVPREVVVIHLPFGRPGRRVTCGGLGVLAATWALLAACSALLCTTCATRLGKERRAWTLTSDRVKRAGPDTGLPDKLEKKRSRPWVVLPALVTTTASPASR